jgi:photosystem II stability/assembly factor-like uncharacterized protein
MKSIISLFLGVVLFVLGLLPAHAQEVTTPENLNYSALKWRGVSTGFASGRISDIAIHPENEHVWYVTAGSGGVWKTENAGVTWRPIFDNQSSYSIGNIALAPSNPSVVWVGTGEDVGGRHVGFGDGIYKSTDGGDSWKHMGLKNSEHISTIIIHPDNENIVWVAVQGPLWSKGGERGLYKTTDGGENWNKVLGDDEWVGVTDIVIDPRNPDVLYAATWQRHRTVAAYMGGGPGSGLHKSTDGGENWKALKNGIPSSNLGKIGLAISPQNPDIVYAAIELDRTKGGLFMSDDQGERWTKMSDMVSGGTGPHYYQELYASPHHFGRIYLMNVRTIVSDDHGKTYSNLPERNKHSDNHALAFRSNDPDYLLIGTDGGVYETFDHGNNWRYLDNLPLTQYYKIAVDDELPFYNLYGGTQDNGTHEGPSATDLSEGIRNADWKHILFADGHDTATEPGNANIVYGETQEGGLHRIDRKTGTVTFIQPQPLEGEDYERYNWDAPILVSPHKPTRLYFASHRVWKSEDRGDSWTPISGDLTRDQERISLPIMGRTQSWDNAWDVNAMSNYNTITSLGESPLQEGLLYVGTDDGIIQVSENGGASWSKIEVGSIKGIPATAFVNDIRADLHDVNTVYAALDNHKYGDFSPYLIKSSNRGKSWQLISGDLPERHLVWRMVQDHVAPNLLFAATEFGVYFTVDGGTEWMKLSAGMPTISVRDITIQQRENDLVAASFGRGYYILDDISPLREISNETLAEDGILFPTRPAKWFMPRAVEIDPGASFFTAKNPEFGATFTYYLKEGSSTLKAERMKKERAMASDQDIPFPGWDALEAEMREIAPYVRISIMNDDGQVIQTVKGAARKGLNRATWDLRLASQNVVSLARRGGGGGWFGGGFMAVPGTYNAQLSLVENGVVTPLDEPIEFEVVPLREASIPGPSFDEMLAFQNELTDFQVELTQFGQMVEKHMSRLQAMQTAHSLARNPSANLEKQLHDAHMQMLELQEMASGSEAKNEIGEKNPPTPNDRMFIGMRGLFTSTHAPTQMHKDMLEIGKKEFVPIEAELERFAAEVMPSLEAALSQTNAPPIEE